jgi:hypothetical protein
LILARKRRPTPEEVERINRGPDPGQIEMLKAKADAIEAAHPEFAAWFRILEKKLLRIKNTAVVWSAEPDLEKLLKRGKRFPKMPIARYIGRTSRCHWNIADIWSDPEAHGFDDRFQIATGWVLDEDNPVWRQHTWGIHDGIIIESTKPRMVYWGVTLNDYEAQEFIENLTEA